MYSELIDKQPIAVNAQLAEKLGLKKAMLLTEIAVLIKKEGKSDEQGILWARITARQLHRELPFFSERTISRYVKELVDNGYLMASKTTDAFDKARLFAIGGSL